MNLRDLQYLIALCDHRHFGKAADVCCVSQPALSMQIKKLEKYLGVQLLERTNKSVMPTAVGIELAERARTILHQVKEIREIAKLSKDPYAGELRIGIIPTIAPYLLPQIMPALGQAFPKLVIYLIEDQTTSLVEKLKQGEIDVAILALPIIETGLVSTILFQEEFMLAVSLNHTLSKQKKVHLSDLEAKPLLLMEEGHCLRDQALSLCQTINTSEIKGFRATSLETLRHMVAVGVGMTLMPKLACKENDGLAYLPFNDPKPTRTIGMIFRASSTRKILLDEIIQLLYNSSIPVYS